MAAPTVVCAGHVNWDVTLYVDTLPAPDGEAVISNQTQAGGGSASNTAAVLSCLDLDPVLLGSIGDDEYAPLVHRELTEVGVDCQYLRAIPDGATTVKYLVVDESGQVMVLANEGANEAFRAEDLPAERLQGASYLHLTSQDPETARALAQRAIEAAVPVSFDPGRRIDRRDFGAVMDMADLLFLNDIEATTARDRGLLAGNDGVTVLKRGSEGAELWNGAESIEHPGFDVDPVDTAGAGDAFAAGFLAARLGGSDYRDALAVGNACGALAVQSIGARTDLSWETIADYREDSS